MAKKHRTLAQVEAERAEREQRRQDTIRQLARDEEQARRERAQEQAREQVEEYRENKPAPAKMDKHGRIEEGPPAAEEELPGPTDEWLKYESARADHEGRRRHMASFGLTMRQALPSPPKEGDPRAQITDAERHRRAQLGIPPKVPGHGRPPWA